LQSTKVGADFAGRFSSGKTLVNDASVVRKWDIVSNLPRSTSTYPAGTLTLVEGRDEDDHLVREYTDWLGRKVLSQVQASASTWFDTYYVYNDYNELLFVIPPSSAATLTPDLAHSNLWHFRYAYDDMGRQIGSKAPGAGWVLTVYDRWDRPVLTQDSVQRAKTPTKEWTYVKYDSHNRPCIVGTLATNSDRAALAPIVEAATGRFETRNTSSVGYTMNASYPTTATESSVLSITYYDDYNFKAGSGFSTTYDFQSVGDYGLSTYWGFNHLTEKLLGLVTGSKSRTQGENIAWMYSVTYYDKYYQPVQTVSSHQHGGKMRSSSLYAFSGEVLKSRTRYEYTGGGITTVERRFTYDHAGRPLKVYHRVDGNDEVLLSHYLYNELGEVTDIIHHSRNEGNTYLYKTTLKSSIQGWTDEITYRFSDNQTTIFQEKLDYQKSNGQGNAQKYSGLITSQRWKHYDTSPEQLYNYTYDIPKRLTGGLYRSKPGATWVNNGLYTETNISYSPNGNITGLLRYTDKSGTSGNIDALSYTYSGNRLTAVVDNATTHKAEGFNDGNTTATDYQYNGNGFLTSDANKGITAITYTAQNLPQQISFGSNTIKYTYDAGGTLMTQVYQGTGGFPNKTVQFVGELVFENGSLTDINHELGRVLANNSFKYQYYLTDHLGSTRVVLQEDPMVFTSAAGFEPIVADQESEQFIGYEEVVRISADMLNHTPGAESSYVMRLSGGYGENVGLAKSISVMPGDTVRMEVFGKYIDIAEAKRNPAVMAVLMAITAADPIGMGIDGALSTSANSVGAESAGLAGLLTSSKEMGDAPPAFLNYLFFDAEMNYKYGGFVQMSNAAREDGSNVPHEHLSQQVVAEEAGYFYIYLSNESNTGSEAFFDDFSIQVSESFIVQQIDYYPYGMIARNVARTTDKQTKDLFQGKTYEDLTKWYDFHARQYDASLGRWFGVDPQDQFASPYLAMGNNPVMMVDPDGEFAILVAAAVGALISGATYTASVALSKGGFSNWNWGQFGKSLAIGAVSGVVTAGIGSAFGPVGSQGLFGEIGRAMAHGQANLMIGGLFGQEASLANYASGALGSLAGSATHNLNGAIQIGTSAMVGGIGAEMSGGDFWRGAAIGGMVASLNHVRHQVQLSNHVKAVRAFLEDLGYDSKQVARDVITHKNSFFGKSFAYLSKENFQKYSASFTGGHLDSYSGTSDAYLSISRHQRYSYVTSRNTVGEGKLHFSLKYYPSRMNSIGIVRTILGEHLIEAGMTLGRFFNLSTSNANYYLKHRNSFYP
jgi:RHS repeat-associated protein